MALLVALAAATVLPPPPDAQGPDRLLVVAGKGSAAGLAGADYRGLAEQTQAAARSAAVLWAALVETTGSESVEEFRVVVQGAVEAARQQGFGGSVPGDVFVAGHGEGGLSAAALAAADGGYAGAVLLGAYVPEPAGTLLDLAVPVLTLAAELDGCTRVTRIAREYAQYAQYAAGNATGALVRKPVAAVLGMSHAQFARIDNNRTVAAACDLAAELADAEAGAQVVAAVGAFVRANTAARDEDVAALRAAVEASAGLLESIGAVGALDSGTRCFESQFHIYNLRAAEEARIGLTVTLYSDFDEFQPMRSSLDNTTAPPAVLVQVATWNDYYANPSDDPSVPVHPDSVYCKTTSQEAVLLYLGGATPAGPSGTCAEANEETTLRALSALPEASQQRYRAEGMPLVFLEDVVRNAGPTWFNTPFRFEVDAAAGVCEVTSPTLYSSPDPTSEYPCCSQYCKLLPPTRALDWILIDSLR